MPEPAQKQLEDIALYLACKGGLFDPGWYRERNPDLGENIYALPHFREFGWREKRVPSPLFNLGAADGVSLPEGENPLIFLCSGQPDYPRFIFGLADGALERGAMQANFFDPEYYLDIYPEVKESGADPFLHYMLWGWRTGCNPSPYFNTGHYIANYCEAGENPLWSRLRAGSDNPTFPDLLTIDDCDADIQRHIGEMTAWAAKKRGLFDEEWYLDAYPDVQEWGISAFEHFRQNGFKEGRNPSLAFDSAWYAREFLDGNEGICALHHYFFVNKWDEAALLRKIQELGEENEALIAEQDVMRRQMTKLEGNAPAASGEIKALKKQIGRLQKQCVAQEERYKHILEFFKDGIGLIFKQQK